MERTLGREFYFSEEIFGREKERIFCREWFCAGLSARLLRAEGKARAWTSADIST
jgi:phenylpropionate dioxygenase-like ring-hydroxylating dioxygenase large terminal subunit